KRELRLTASHIPDLRSSVSTSAYQPRAVRTERQAVDSIAVAGEHMEQGPFSSTPYPHCPVGAAGGQPTPVGGYRGAPRLTFRPVQSKQLLACLALPEPGGAVDEARHQMISVPAHGDSAGAVPGQRKRFVCQTQVPDG